MGKPAGGSVVTEDDLALPESPHEPDEVLHLGRRDARDAVGVEERGNASSEPEREPSLGQ